MASRGQGTESFRRFAKERVGSVGISGAPGSKRDAACAQASMGIDKIAKGLSP